MDNNPISTNSPKTLDAIYLQPLDKKYGGYDCIHLQTVHKITGYNVKGVPVTNIVIKASEAMKSEQVIKALEIKGKKISTSLCHGLRRSKK